MKNKSKKIIVIILITIVLVALGVALPIIVKGDNNTARTSEVLSGKTFSTGSVVGLTGSMKDFSGQIPEVTATVEAADEDYIATIDLDDGYYESVKINAKPIYDAGVAEGTASLTGGNAGASHMLKDKTAYVNGKLVTGTMETLTSENFTGTHSGTTAGAASTYTVKSTLAGYVPNGRTVATLAATTSAAIDTTAESGTKTINIVPGYYNKIKVNQTPAYNAGKAAGTTSLTGGNATAAQILKDKTAYVNGKLVTGTMVNNGKVTKTINPGESYTIPAGYHNGQGTVTANANQNSGTYTFASGSTGGKTDMGANNTYRYVNATNVYNKGKADGAKTMSNVNCSGWSDTSISCATGDIIICYALNSFSTISFSGATVLSSRTQADFYPGDQGYDYKVWILRATSTTVTVTYSRSGDQAFLTRLYM